MRILYITAHYPPDFVSGATLQVQRLAERAAAAGHEVTVFSGAIAAGLPDGATVDERVAGVDVRWFGTRSWIEQDDDRNWRNPAATAAVGDLLDERPPDIVHAHALQTLGAGLIDAALDRRLRVVLTMHDLWWWCPRLFLVDPSMQPCSLVTDASACACARTAAWRLERAATLRRTLDRVAELLVPSPAMRELVIANGVDPSRVFVDANDVDVADAATPVAVAHTGVEFVYVGGDHAVKGVDVMLAAARHLGDVTGWRLTAYGVAERRLPRGVPVRFRPPYPPSEVGTVLAGADVLVIPSIARESFTIAAREALAAGVAVITSDCVGPEEVVRAGENGFVVPTGDPVALAGTMRRLVGDRALLATLREGARRSAPALRSPDEHAATILGRYGTAPPMPGDRPSPIAVLTDGAPSPRLRRLVDALRIHGTTAAIVDGTDPSLPSTLTTAGSVLIAGTATDVAGDSLLAARRAGTTVVVDLGDGPIPGDGPIAGGFDGAITAIPDAPPRLPDGRPLFVVPDGVGADDLMRASPAAAAPIRRRRLRGSRPDMTVVAVPASPAATEGWRLIERAVGEAVRRSRRARLTVVDGLDRAPLSPHIVLIPPGLGTAAAQRLWMLAALAGAATVVGDDHAGIVRPGRTALVAGEPAEWAASVTRLLDNGTLRAVVAAAARREVMLRHGPHTVAGTLLTALAGIAAAAGG